MAAYEKKYGKPEKVKKIKKVKKVAASKWVSKMSECEAINFPLIPTCRLLAFPLNGKPKCSASFVFVESPTVFHFIGNNHNPSLLVAVLSFPFTIPENDC